jgi:hypothetical protein
LVGGRTERVRKGYRDATPPALSTHRATPGAIKPSGSNVLSTLTVADVVVSTVPIMDEVFTGAIAPIVISPEKIKSLQNEDD